MSDLWNLVCAGESRQHLRKEHLLDGPVVTVNRAMDISGRLPVDFAAWADGPSGCWLPMDMQKFWKPGMLLWVTTRTVAQKVKTVKGDEATVPGPPLAKIWDNALPASIGFRFMPWGVIEDDDTKTERAAFTTACALRGILRYKPTHIRILCMDMKGSWVPGMTEETCNEFYKARDGLDRWKHERRTMERAMNRLRSDGIKCESIIPEALP